MIVIIGDKPSKKNKNQEIAFVGTKSYKTLLNWIADLELDINEIVLANKNHIKKHKYTLIIETPNTCTDIVSSDKWIALGKNASDYLTAIKLDHYKLPHPSGKNFKLNDKKYIKNELNKCKEWLNG